MTRQDDVELSYRRWQRSESEARDDDADAEFRDVFAAAMPSVGVSAAFTARTMAAVSEAAVREARRSRRVRAASIAAGLLGTVGAAYFGAGFVVSAASAIVAGAFDLLIGGVVGMAGAAQTGAGVWSVLAHVGRAVGAAASDRTVTMTLFALQGIAVAALLALQRLLGTDEESLK